MAHIFGIKTGNPTAQATLRRPGRNNRDILDKRKELRRRTIVRMRIPADDVLNMNMTNYFNLFK